MTLIIKLRKIEDILNSAANIFDKLYGDETGQIMRNKCREGVKLVNEIIEETVDANTMREMSEDNED